MKPYQLESLRKLERIRARLGPDVTEREMLELIAYFENPPWRKPDAIKA